MAVGIDLHLTDDAGIASTAAYDETLAVGLTDETPNLVILTQITVSDSALLGLTDISASPVQLFTTTDALTGGLIDTVFLLFQSVEGIPINMTDTAQLFVVIIASDSLSMTTSEIPSISSTQEMTDVLTLGLDDASPDVPLLVQVTDSLSVVTNDDTPTIDTGLASTAFLTAADTVEVGLSDDTPVSELATSAEDTLEIQIPDVGIYEDVFIFGFVLAQLYAVGVVDTCVIQVPTIPINRIPISASDSILIALTEPSDSTLAFSGLSDSLRAGQSESVNINTGMFMLSASDSAAVKGTEGAPTFAILTHVDITAADTNRIRAADGVAPNVIISAQLTVTENILLGAADPASVAVVVLTTDSLRLRIAPVLETGDVLASCDVTDSLTVQSAEGAPEIAVSFAFNTTDSVRLQSAESAPTFLLNQPVAATDSLKGQVSEGGQLIAVAGRAAETLGVTLNEAASLLLKFLLITDSLKITASDAASIFSTFIQLSTSDSARINQSDLVVAIDQVMTQLTVTDSLRLKIFASETSDVWSNVSAQESVTVTAQEQLFLSLTYALKDSLAFVAQAENVNVINPSVIIVFVFTDDTVSINWDYVGSGGIPSPIISEQILMIVVTDQCAVKVGDLGLSENRPLPTYWDAHQGYSYETLADPVSYRIQPVRTW